MNPFDSAWDFFKAADRRSIADPSASKGSSGGHLQPYDKALGEKADEIDRKKQSDKKYLAEMASAAPDSPPPPTEGDPRTEEIYEDLPDEAFPQGPPLEAPKSRGNPFTRSEPFDAAWSLLKQWDDTDWTGEQQPPADDWAGVDWSQQPMGYRMTHPSEWKDTQFSPAPITLRQLALQSAMQNRIEEQGLPTIRQTGPMNFDTDFDYPTGNQLSDIAAQKAAMRIHHTDPANIARIKAAKAARAARFMR